MMRLIGVIAATPAALVAATMLCAGCGDGSDPGLASNAAPDSRSLVDDPRASTRAGRPLPTLAAPGEVAAGRTAADDFALADPEASRLSPDTACAATAVEAETVEQVIEVPVVEEVVVPSVFYLMLDSSGSMVQDPFSLAGLVEQILDLFGLGQSPASPTKWDFAVGALKEFVADPASAGLELGLGYFPDGGACDGSGYDVPAVGLGVLPEHASALEASLDARVPAGGTPLEGALRGALRFCLDYNAEHPEASCVAVLITDGAAEECSARSAPELGSIAASAAEQGVLTFAAGMQGADFGVLDAIGQASGSDCDPEAPGFACDLTSDRDAFLAALEGIRDRTRTQTRVETRIERRVTALPCTWEIPPPPAGERFDAARVNVELTLPGEAPLALDNVAEVAGCASDGGWYYDDALSPQHIELCPASCERASDSADARVDLLFGCAIVIR